MILIIILVIVMKAVIVRDRYTMSGSQCHHLPPMAPHGGEPTKVTVAQVIMMIIIVVSAVTVAV